MKHTISVLVENEFGVLARVASLFSGRGYNISSLTVAETLDPKVSRMTIVTEGSDAVLEQIVKQLNKLVNVIKVHDVTAENPINRTLALVKVPLTTIAGGDVTAAIREMGGEVVDSDRKCCIAEFRGDESKISSVIERLKPFGILEFEQTGNIAMQKGTKVIS
ncbi:MAG: acetolactate synthase small subunit [Deltaproteobacteria bacterium]|nr:acetolactate synthase small subunit [Deltaproteobacteria bacterium]